MRRVPCTKMQPLNTSGPSHNITLPSLFGGLETGQIISQ